MAWIEAPSGPRSIGFHRACFLSSSAWSIALSAADNLLAIEKVPGLFPAGLWSAWARLRSGFDLVAEGSLGHVSGGLCFQPGANLTGPAGFPWASATYVTPSITLTMFMPSVNRTMRSAGFTVPRSIRKTLIAQTLMRSGTVEAARVSVNLVGIQTSPTSRLSSTKNFSIRHNFRGGIVDGSS